MSLPHYLNGLLGVAGENVIKLIPLGKKLCLFIKELTNNPALVNYEIHSKKAIRYLNTYIVDNSNEFLIAGEREQLEKLVKMRIKNN